eukprot:6073910-Pyramimonas_sp.AAC.1
MSAWCRLVHICGRASPRMLARAAASYPGAADAAPVALTAGHIPVGTPLRVDDVGGGGIMTTSTT